MPPLLLVLATGTATTGVTPTLRCCRGNAGCDDDADDEEGGAGFTLLAESPFPTSDAATAAAEGCCKCCGSRCVGNPVGMVYAIGEDDTDVDDDD